MEVIKLNVLRKIYIMIFSQILNLRKLLDRFCRKSLKIKKRKSMKEENILNLLFNLSKQFPLSINRNSFLRAIGAQFFGK